ncbi:hypothetical protein M569_17740 [Genlisea aurea]|uniref:Uncharacterized protein n=1 Tax=Genlisea aurea TaxID=192259 RepID=S8BR30_9LAMI|nr:hypothetical protein M569_17740 [Genlisea aurea]
MTNPTYMGAIPGILSAIPTTGLGRARSGMPHLVFSPSGLGRARPLSGQTIRWFAVCISQVTQGLGSSAGRVILWWGAPFDVRRGEGFLMRELVGISSLPPLDSELNGQLQFGPVV